MIPLFDAYRAVHTQAFLPIFTEDGTDAWMLVEACLEAGLKAIEYTQRRRDAPEMIPAIRARYPELTVLVGSTIDDDCLIQRARHQYPQLRTVDELAKLGVSGFVSASGWSVDSIRKYNATHLIAPTASTVTEAVQQLGAGAHFIKMIGTDLLTIQRCRQTALFDVCPIFATGGISHDRIAETVSAGAVLVGSGFDVMIKGDRASVNYKDLIGTLRQYVETAITARDRRWPQLSATKDSPDQDWLAALPHHHPFACAKRAPLTD